MGFVRNRDELRFALNAERESYQKWKRWSSDKREFGRNFVRELEYCGSSGFDIGLSSGFAMGCHLLSTRGYPSEFCQSEQESEVNWFYSIESVSRSFSIDVVRYTVYSSQSWNLGRVRISHLALQPVTTTSPHRA